jgi:predicted ATPase with chaperone activity
MAVALPTASEQLTLDPAQHLFLGELGLDGTLPHTTGILPMAALARERATPTVSCLPSRPLRLPCFATSKSFPCKHWSMI